VKIGHREIVCDDVDFLAARLVDLDVSRRKIMDSAERTRRFSKS